MLLLVGVGIAAAATAHTAAAAGWSIQPVPRPPHAGDTDLFGVSCTSERDCFAVGDSDLRSNLNSIPLVEHWDGARWSIERTPRRTAPGWSAWLSAVSCTSSKACIAVGSAYTNSAGERPLAERWNGSAWSIQRTPSGVNGEFEDVSCASSTACTAVGGGVDSFEERWNGERWSVAPIRFTDPRGGTPELAGVSCPSASMCAAVGTDDVGLCGNPDTSDYFVPVLGFWTSGRWSFTRNPDIGCSRSGDNEGGNGLSEVSCTTPTACTAVGAKVYRWDGRGWTVQPAPTDGQDLTGVSCTSDGACTAVGSKILTWDGHAWSSANAAAPGLDTVSCTSLDACVAVGSWEDNRATNHMVVESIGIGSGR